MAAVALSAVTLTLACRCFEAAGEQFAARAPGFYLNSLGKPVGDLPGVTSLFSPVAKGPASLLQAPQKYGIKVGDGAEGSCLHFLEA